MKEIIRYGAILAIICVIASGLLAGVNFMTEPRIAAIAQAEEEASLKEVLPMAASFEKAERDGRTFYYKGLDDGNRLIGIAFKASGKGYSSVIETIVGMELSGKITAIKILSQNETPGLGARIAEKEFSGQFRGEDALSLSGIEAVTAATISSRAVVDSVKQKAQELKELIKNE